MKIRRGIVGAAAVLLGSSIAGLGLAPSGASVGTLDRPHSMIDAMQPVGSIVRASTRDGSVLPPFAQVRAAVAAAMAERTRASQADAVAAIHAAAVRRVVGSYYHETVWTSGFQAQIDACRGAVNLAPSYHVAVIGEKWQCGGSRFPREGSVVVLSGVINGVYRVGPVVAVLNAYVAKTSNIPRGYALLYQTCRYGNAHTETFTELIPAS